MKTTSLFTGMSISPETIGILNRFVESYPVVEDCKPYTVSDCGSTCQGASSSSSIAE